MRKRLGTRWVLVVVALIAAGFMSCNPPTAPDDGEDGNVTVTQTVIVGGPSPGAPGSPGTPGATCGTVAANRVGFFGIGCPNGVSPRNGQGVLPMGCVGFATQTPKNAQGQDVPASVHGPLAAWAATTGAERVRLVDVEEPFNKNVIPQALGDVVITGTVTPPSCGPVSGTLSFQVTAATSSSGGVAAAHEGDVLNVYREPDGAYMGTYRLGDPWPGWLEAMDGTPMPPYPPPPALLDHLPPPGGNPPNATEGSK